MNARQKKAQQLAGELEAIYRREGVLKPESVVKWARSNTRSELYSRFQWDNTKAAHEYRLLQARHLITEVEVIYPDGKKRQVYVSPVESRSTKGGGYVPLVAVLSDKQRRTNFLAQALAEYQRVGDKYADLRELADVREAVARVARSARTARSVTATKARRAA